MYYSFIEQGLLMDLEPLMQQYGPNVYTYRTQAQLDALRHTDGKIYAINSNAETDFDMLAIRGDWLEKVGLSMPTTIDAFTEVLRAFRDQDPDGNGENDTQGMGAFNNLLVAFSPIWAAYGANPRQWVWLEDGSIGYGAAQEPMKAAVKYLQSLYAEGLINSDFVVNSGNAEVNAEAANNKIGLLSAQLWHADPHISTLGAATDWTCIPYLELTEGSGGGYLTNGNPIVRNFTCIPIDSKDPALAMLYLNWLGELDNYTVIRAGYEGEHYDIVDGVITTRPEFVADNSLLINNGITATYAMPFLPLDPVREMYMPQTNVLLEQRRENEAKYYAAMYWPVPAIKADQLDAGMNDFITQSLCALIMDAGADVDAGIDTMVATLKSNYNLDKQTELVNAYAKELGYIQ